MSSNSPTGRMYKCLAWIGALVLLGMAIPMLTLALTESAPVILGVTIVTLVAFMPGVMLVLEKYVPRPTR